MGDLTPVRSSPWPRRLLVALALVTFPLIWVGGLVTTYDAGMAVPDWPGTYGYNLLLYPWQTWVVGPWDLFIEHGHRLLGALAGILVIGLVIAVLLTDRRKWLIYAAVGALVLVIVQGVLGGARVLFDARLVALAHGCLGPLFFGYLAALIAVTDQSAQLVDEGSGAHARRLAQAAWIVVALAYVQLVLGAVVRHIPLAASPRIFQVALFMHLVVAAILVLQVGRTSWLGWTQRSTKLSSLPVVGLLPILVVCQITLGLATYVAKYSFPTWLDQWQFAAGYVVQEKSLVQSLITTAHVAVGSLILFVAVWLAAHFGKLTRRELSHGRLSLRERTCFRGAKADNHFRSGPKSFLSPAACRVQHSA